MAFEIKHSKSLQRHCHVKSISAQSQSSG